MTVSSPQTAAPPIPTRTRQALPDQLRGVALLGIAAVNMPFLALSNDGLTAGTWEGPLDGTVAFLIVAFAQGKFYLLFSFLFGYSSSFLLRGGTRQDRVRFARRLGGLALFGLAHAVAFFVGDILVSYAILGLGLLAVYRVRTRLLLILAAAVFGVWLVVLSLGALSLAVSGPGPVGSGAGTGGLGGEFSAPLDSALAAGSLLETMVARAQALPLVLSLLAVLNWAPALAMFLLGLVVSRTDLLIDPQRHRALWRRLLALAVLVGLPGGLVSGWLFVTATDPDSTGTLVGAVVGFVTGPALSAGYVAALALATRTRLARAFEPAGRASLTGYVGESAVMALIFCGWGFGLFGLLPVWAALLVSVAVFLLLDATCSLWLRHHRHGPLEAVLRRITNGPGRRPSA